MSKKKEARNLSHELTHSIQKWNPEGYEELKGFIIENIGDSFEGMVSRRMKQLKLDRADAIDEVVAYSCKMMFRDSKALTDFAKEHRTLFEKICDFVDEFINKIRSALASVYGDIVPGSQEARFMELYADELQMKFDKALSDALNASEATVDHTLQSNANKKAAEDGGKVQYSKGENYLDVVKSIGNDSGYRSEEAYVKVGDYTPDILIEKAGAKQRPIATKFALSME